ncbi:hypothetical protein L228DRAFT_268018 [Xylona heveae TC161]|uniref:Fungal-type protein kinase domain-containing protein n=1 Tax=Xylona heveae (strain CBS 132557 / TC161) TaxID=1328760 RepID=A0A165GUZ4_XYLHT|nr:hypothetical protein L228DRAFT_268018 [Xylona heveae TC161]KZF22629.1 hypothetical protein L228DRAFT_268018 [Xylona heveae TC161]
MASDFREEIIKKRPIGRGLDSFRNSLNSKCRDLGIAEGADILQRLDDEGIKDTMLELVRALQILPAAYTLRSGKGRGFLAAELANLYSRLDSNEENPRSVIPLFSKVIRTATDDEVWNAAYELITESTPPPRPLASVFQTPSRFTSSNIVDSSEHRKDMDPLLKEELGPIYVGVPGFYEAFFCTEPARQTIFEAVFAKCQAGDNPLYRTESGWRDWPEGSREKDVLSWLSTRVNLFVDLAKVQPSAPKVSRRPVAQPAQPLAGSTAGRKLDIGFVDEPSAREDSRCHWAQILVPGELKSNPSADNTSKTWLDLGRYAREVLTAQDMRRSVLGFTLCGSLMRLWLFDRIGAMASVSFDIHGDGLRFVSVVLTFLWMSREQLGFDPSIIELDGQHFIEIGQGKQKERLIIDELIKRATCIAGRATTCWKAHREGDDSKTVFVIKDSWQYTEREEEGVLLREATEKKVRNVARYHYHETVLAGGDIDDVCNIRKGLDITKATNYIVESQKAADLQRSSPTPSSRSEADRGRSFEIPSIIGRKRSSSSFRPSLPSSKRACSSSPTKRQSLSTPGNREHRRVIIRDYGTPLHKASSVLVFVRALWECLQGCKDLYEKTGLLQCDISTGNLRMNEDEGNPSWFAFIIDLDLAVRADRTGPSPVRHKTGTRPFMAVGVMQGELRAIKHDYESFFWVFFWFGIHYNGPHGKSRVVRRFENWNYMDIRELAEVKKGVVADEEDFLQTVEEYFTPFYQPLIPWVNRLRKIIFPGGSRRKDSSPELFSLMDDLFQKAQEALASRDS